MAKAYRKSTVLSASTSKRAAIKARTPISVRCDQLELILGYSEISGQELSSLVDEAFSDFIDCAIRARTEGLLKQARKSERKVRKEAETRAIDECLAELERDLATGTL